MPVYADTDAWTAEYPDVAQPANADTLLLAASGLVDRLLVGVVYDVDENHAPTDDDIATLLRGATLALVAEWVTLSTMLPGGTSQDWDSISIGSVSLSKLRGSNVGGLTLDGLPVPPLAVSLLAQVGPVQFWALT
jgi:hypothetical protein